LVLDYGKIYEIVDYEEDRVYILLTDSWFSLLDQFESERLFVVTITFSIYFEYSEHALFIEQFNGQLNLQNQQPIREMFARIRNENQ
jgi:hypothetical protein